MDIRSIIKRFDYADMEILVRFLSETDYHNREFIIEDIDGDGLDLPLKKNKHIIKAYKKAPHQSCFTANAAPMIPASLSKVAGKICACE